MRRQRGPEEAELRLLPGPDEFQERAAEESRKNTGDPNEIMDPAVHGWRDDPDDHLGALELFTSPATGVVPAEVRGQIISCGLVADAVDDGSVEGAFDAAGRFLVRQFVAAGLIIAGYGAIAPVLMQVIDAIDDACEGDPDAPEAVNEADPDELAEEDEIERREGDASAS